MDAIEELPTLVTVPDAAKWLGLSEHTVRTLIRDGQLRTMQVGRYKRVHRVALMAFADGDLAGAAAG